MFIAEDDKEKMKSPFDEYELQNENIKVYKESTTFLLLY